MEPQYRYCTSADGTRISFSTLGGGPLPTHLIVDGWGSVQEWIWQVPENFAFDSDIAQERCVVRYDRRGVGGSQRTADDLSLDARVADVRAIVEQLELTEFDLTGGGDGTPTAMAYAARYPDSVRRLILWSPYARGPEVHEPGRMNSLAALMRSDWSLGRRTFASFAYPNGPAEKQREYSAMLRDAVAPEVAARYLEFETDVRAIVPLIRCPALVLDPRGGFPALIRASRDVAALIPNARRAITRGDHSREDWREQLAIVREFLGEGTPPREAQASGLRTVLFTDIVGHAEMMERLGDAKGRDVLREHERITRETLRQHGGAEVKTMGDGFLASFGSVTQAMECAMALQRAFAGWNDERAQAETDGAEAPSLQAPSLHVRVGLNAGEPIEEGGDLFGATVIMASRVCAEAGAGEILIPEPVRHLLRGKTYVYADRGETLLKGFEDAVRLYEVRAPG
jgi:class 3 adenylate cyclase